MKSDCENRMRAYARELVDLRIEHAKRDGLTQEEALDLVTILLDAYLKEDAKHPKTPAPKKIYEGTGFVPSRRARILERLLELWNGGDDEFYIDDMLDISIDDMQRYISQIANTERRFQGFKVKTRRDQQGKTLYITIAKNA